MWGTNLVYTFYEISTLPASQKEKPSEYSEISGLVVRYVIQLTHTHIYFLKFPGHLEDYKAILKLKRKSIPKEYWLTG